tara:strand:- start:336 stop:476 length:141 start_codon:yes stop_codon:yes gene_type:complete
MAKMLDIFFISNENASKRLFRRITCDALGGGCVMVGEKRIASDAAK